MSKFIENIKSLGKKRLIAGAAVFLVTAILVSTVTYFASRPDMTVLYAGLDPAEAGQALTALETLGIQVQAGNGGTSLLVPRADVDRAKMSLAEKGLPTTPGVGYELFDKADGFGLTTFMQRVNRLRAMEGELARTIGSLSGVDNSRVHLVLPDRDSFSRSAPDASASVVVHMRGGRVLEKTQAQAIRHLVAAAVPALKPTSVTISDSKGEIILSEDDTGNSSDDTRTTLESRLQTSVEDILTARLGKGNVRVGVTVEIEKAREVKRRQEFDPNGRVVRSTQTVEDKQNSSDNSGEAPTTVQQNLPNSDLLNGSAAGQNATNSERSEETVNYEITNEVIERVIEPGDIRKISIAVLVNGSYTEAEDGTKTYQNRTPEEVASLQNLVKTAMAFNPDRGDQVSVETLQFADLEEATFADNDSLGSLLKENADKIALWTVLILFGILAFIFIVRPLVRFVTNESGNNTSDASSASIMDDNPLAQLGFGGASGDDLPFALNLSTQTNEISREMLIVALHQAVDENPEEALSVLRTWIQEGTPA